MVSSAVRGRDSYWDVKAKCVNLEDVQPLIRAEETGIQAQPSKSLEILKEFQILAKTDFCIQAIVRQERTRTTG